MLLSERLTELRKASKLRLIDISTRCGCSYQHLQKLESGKATRPKIELLKRLAAFYQFSEDTLIMEAGKISPDVYWKIVRNPQLLQIIRDYPE